MTSRELYYDVAKSHIQSQDAQHRDLETKSLRYTTASLTITGLLVTLLLSTQVQIEGWRVVAPAVAVGLSVLASAVLTSITLWTREFWINPRLDDFAKYLGKMERDDDYWIQWAGKAMRKAYEHNEGIIERKAKWIRWNQITTLVHLVASLLLVAISVTGVTTSPVSVSQG